MSEYPKVVFEHIDKSTDAGFRMIVNVGKKPTGEIEARCYYEKTSKKRNAMGEKNWEILDFQALVTQFGDFGVLPDDIEKEKKASEIWLKALMEATAEMQKIRNA